MNHFQSARVREEPISSPKTWMAKTMLPNDGLVRLEARHLDELHSTAVELRANPLPIEELKGAQFHMPACHALMAQVRGQLHDGIGFAIIDRLPVDDIEPDTAKKLYWLLMNMIGQTVAQTWDGTMVYDVIDTDRQTEAGNGVRASKTNQGQRYHVDNAFNLPPDFVGLCCLQTAMEGGLSGLISFETVYNRLLDQYQEVIGRLYRPFYFDRQQEHAPEDEPTANKPMVEYDGQTIAFNFNLRLVQQGYALAGVEMDGETKAALDALRTVSESADLGKTFEFERGQIQIANNRQLGHRRTAFKDHLSRDRRRHLVRVWIREHGRPLYPG